MPDAEAARNEPNAEAAPSLAVTCVRALMERHGLPKYRQSAWLADATGLSYSQAHRRMSGVSPWSLEDLEKVAALFGETLADVVGAAQPGVSVAAVLTIGTAQMPCRLWLGQPVDRHAVASSMVAVKTSSGWSAVLASEVNDEVVYRIEKLEARPVAATRKAIAVLDDDQDLTNSICAHLEANGYDARPFYKIADLLASATAQTFDGYVVDWIVGETSVAKLIAAIREKDPKAPIVVLTAQVMTGVVEEAEIAEAVKRYDLTFHEKPVRSSILEATLARALTGAAA